MKMTKLKNKKVDKIILPPLFCVTHKLAVELSGQNTPPCSVFFTNSQWSCPNNQCVWFLQLIYVMVQ